MSAGRDDYQPPTTGYGERSGGPDLARAALAAARARAREIEEGRALRRRGGGRQPARRSGARPDDRDPQPLEATLARLLAEAGWEQPAAVGGIIHGWADIVGPRIAAHCEPVSFDDGVLTVQTDSSAWATELRNLSSVLLAKLNAAMPRRAASGGTSGYPRSGYPARPDAGTASRRDRGGDDLLSLIGDDRGDPGGGAARIAGSSRSADGVYRPEGSPGELRGAIQRIAVLGPHPPSWRRSRSGPGSRLRQPSD
jgi:predicted nucleic acid-binding Zn ribbon protein